MVVIIILERYGPEKNAPVRPCPEVTLNILSNTLRKRTLLKFCVFFGFFYNTPKTFQDMPFYFLTIDVLNPIIAKICISIPN